MKNLKTLLDKNFTPAQQAEHRADAERTIAALREVRAGRKLTQAQLADALGIAQGEVSKIERRSDLYLSTLRKYVEAMDGELILVAKFGDDAIPFELPAYANDREPALA
jgi:transcriptional regulator with XRE-family HTH domain